MREETNQFYDGSRDTMTSSYSHRQNMRGYVTTPTSLKVGVVLLEIIFLNTELNKAHFLRDEMIFMHCLLQIK